MTTYICTYFNINNNPLRKKLTQEFCDRYPWVILLQACYGEVCDIRSSNCVRYKLTAEKGFLIYMMINDFLKKNRVCNLVLIDSDLILENNFRDKMEAALETSDFVHGFDKSYELIDGALTGEVIPSYYLNLVGGGHTGYIYGYSQRFLEKINHTFLDCFLLGGFDYVLARILTGKSLDPFKKFIFFKHILEFAEKIRGCDYAVLVHRAIHCYHGPRHLRLAPFHIYANTLYMPCYKVNC